MATDTQNEAGGGEREASRRTVEETCVDLTLAEARDASTLHRDQIHDLDVQALTRLYLSGLLTDGIPLEYACRIAMKYQKMRMRARYHDPGEYLIDD